METLPSLSNHVIYIGNSDGILDFISPLRTIRSSLRPPILFILDTKENLPFLTKIASHFEEVYILIGSLDSISAANRVELSRCRHVSIVPSEVAHCHDDFMSDSNTIFITRFIQRILFQQNQQAYYHFSFYLELMSSSNLKFINRISEESDSKSVNMFNSDLIRRFQSYNPYGKVVKASEMIHPLTASGRILFSEIILKMIPNIWKGNGKLMDLVRLLLRAPSHPSQMSLSAFLSCDPVPANAVGFNFQNLLLLLLSSPSAQSIPIAIYRECAGAQGLFRYVLTNPQKHTIITENDFVFALRFPPILSFT